MTTLNNFIFSDLLIFLLKDLNIKEILNYSLISKQTFKITQNILTFNSKEINLVISYESFISYILKDNHYENNNDNDNIKLINYKNIEYIICKTQKDQIYPILPLEIKEKCKNLKRIHFMNLMDSRYYTGSIYSDSHVHEQHKPIQYSFERVRLMWELGYRPGPPISDKKELSEYNNQQHQIYQYSFKILQHYKPTKMYLISNDDDYGFDLLRINNILNESSSSSSSSSSSTSSSFTGNYNQNNLPFSTKTIKFSNQNTPCSFIKCLLDNSKNNYDNIKSIGIRLCNVDEEDTIIKDEPISNQLFLKTFSNLSKNKSIKRLLFYPRLPEPDEKEINFLENLFHCLKGNKQINTLGLINYNIDNDNDLSILNQLIDTTSFPIINTLYCNSKSLEKISLHINRNENINTLKIHISNYIPFKEFENFLISNQSKHLKTIKILYACYFSFEKEIDQFEEIFSKNNKNLNLKNLLFLREKN
ncbi:hypothetical protein ACTFIY_007549 [Dictyostelium cf. discoideum]